MKTILSEPERAKFAVDAYLKNVNALAPELQSQINALEKDLTALRKRELNLVTRISDLPPEMDAGLFYKSIKDIQVQIADKSKIKLELESKSKAQVKHLDPKEILARVQSAVNKLEKAPKEDQRAIFENLISFAEFQPTKLKLGVFVGSTTIKNGGVGGI